MKGGKGGKGGKKRRKETRGNDGRGRQTGDNRQHAAGERASSEKPSYLGLLNAIAVGEGQADELLRAWCGATDNAELRGVLEFVAIRECEHSAAFTKRICELGYSVRQTGGEDFPHRLELAGSGIPDREKFQKLFNISGPRAGEDPFAGMFADKTIDPVTGGLLGRYIAEERDSGRRLEAAYAALPEDAGDDPVLEDIAERLDRLSATLEELKSIRN